MRRPCGSGLTWAGHSGSPGTPPYGHYGPCAGSQLDGATHKSRCVRKRGPGLAGSARVRPRERRDGASRGERVPLNAHTPLRREDKERLSALHPLAPVAREPDDASGGMPSRDEFVMAGLVPAIHVLKTRHGPKTWMPATSAGMTTTKGTLFDS